MCATAHRSLVEPNLADYEQACQGFSWEAARAWLDGLPENRGLNIAHEAVDRHAAGPRRHHLALRCLSRLGLHRDITYEELADHTNRFANALATLGVQPGDRIFVLAGRIPELVIAALGTLKARAIFAPLFAAFGPEPIQARCRIGQPKVFITTQTLYRRRIGRIRDTLESVEHVILIPDEPAPLPEGVIDWHELLGETGGIMIANLAALEVHPGSMGRALPGIEAAIVAHHATGRLALDLHEDDIFWCTADPGWVTGTSYGILAPLACGITSILDEGEFDARRWCRLIQEEQVTVWYTAPTAIRMMMSTTPRACGLPPASASRSTRRRWSGVSRPSGCPSTTTGGRPRPAGS